MPTLFWDASALAKHYVIEPGTETVEALLTERASLRMLTTPWGYAETFAIRRCKHNDRRIGTATFVTTTSALRNEVILGTDYDLLTVEDATIIGCIAVIEKHNLNSVDAALLVTWMRYVRSLPLDERDSCILVTADQRLMRTAIAEGLAALNPETFSADDVPAFLAAL